MKKNLIIVLSAILVLSMMLSACGSEKAPETTAAATTATTAATLPAETTTPQPLALTDWNLSASTWSSPNGATIHIAATPSYYAEGQKADFVVRLESDEIASVPCQWNGTEYTASADLNAADGYCYYVVLTAADGTVAELPVNTPVAPTNEAYINLESSLASYCNVVIEESAFEGNRLTLIGGNVQVQAPAITNEGEIITCREAVLVLNFNGEALEQKVLTLTETETAGLYEAAVENIVFEIPEMEDDQNVELTVNAALSNGQLLSAFGGDWFYNEEGLLPVVG